MDEPDLALTPMNPGIFERLSEHKDIRCVIFRLLQPSSVNGLRKTCKELSQVLSFCNPFLEFIACNNPYIAQNDLTRIFLTSIYDNKHTIVRCLMNSPLAFSKSMQVGIYDALLPYPLAQDKDMRLLLKEFEKEKNGFSGSFESNSPLLIACISKDSERIKKILLSGELLLSEYIIERALQVTIDGTDTQSFMAISCNEKIQAYVKNNGVILINKALYNKDKKYCEMLLASNLCNLNQVLFTAGMDEQDKELPEHGQYLRDLEKEDPSTLLDNFISNKEMYETDLGQEWTNLFHTNLIQKGAKTAEELAEEYREKIIG